METSAMAKGAARKPRARARGRRREPDDALTRRGGVAYRYVLRLREAHDAAAILALLSDLALPLRYLLLLPSGSQEQHAAYVGLGTPEVADLPIRLASRGVRVERGEELGSGSAAMRQRIARCKLAPNGAKPPQPGAMPSQRRTP
jgi:hypothetical protein